MSGKQAPGRGLMTRERPKRGRSSLVSCIAVLAGVLLSSHRPASGATGPVAPQVVVLELFKPFSPSPQSTSWGP